MKITIVDYGSGNLRSVAKAFERASSDLGEAVEVVVSCDAADVMSADKVVLPGVGAFGDCRRSVREISGLEAALHEVVRVQKRPFLGICVGMQLMADTGEEHGLHDGFGWIKGAVKPLTPADPALKIPHMGWNELTFAKPHAVLEGLDQGSPHAYFVHSFAVRGVAAADLVATADYAGPVTAIVARDNMIGTQFHPEKSQAFGLGFLLGFMKWKP